MELPAEGSPAAAWPTAPSQPGQAAISASGPSTAPHRHAAGRTCIAQPRTWLRSLAVRSRRAVREPGASARPIRLSTMNEPDAGQFENTSGLDQSPGAGNAAGSAGKAAAKATRGAPMVTSLVTSPAPGCRMYTLTWANTGTCGCLARALLPPAQATHPGSWRACDQRKQSSMWEAEPAGCPPHGPERARNLTIEICPDLGKHLDVELRGLEPLASCMPWNAEPSKTVHDGSLWTALTCGFVHDRPPGFTSVHRGR